MSVDCPYCSQRAAQAKNLDGPNFCPRCRKLFYVPEEPNLYPHLSGLEYLQLVGRLRGDTRKAQKFAQFVNETRLVGFEVMEDGFHRDCGHGSPFGQRWQNE